MKNLWHKIWNSEPVIFIGSLVGAWLALVSLDQADETWAIPLWVYILMTLLVPFLTGVTRKQVTAPANMPSTDSR